MSNALQKSAPTDYDAIVIGAGISGMYQLYRMREAGFSVKVFEAGTGVGGTWYWNRYPGARFDSESYSYAYSFDDELLQEWDWKEHFSAQPDTLDYLNHVADKFDLRKDIQFNASIKAATYNEDGNFWDIETEAGEHATARYMITAVGPLSAYQFPPIPGIDSFKGTYVHTARWPKAADGTGGADIGIAGKRVAIIGTGATGIQVIQEVAKTAGQMTVFQLDANWAAPLNNSKITDEEQVALKANYPAMFKQCNESFGGFLHAFKKASALEATPEEREAYFEKLYGEPGFGIWLGNYIDIASDLEANKLITDFIEKKIRSRVNDPAVAEILVPKDHGFGMRRVPMETNYFEVYNQDNVLLVDLNDTPIKEITPNGVKCSDKEYEFDIIIYATGFDAVTGAFNRIDIRGKGGEKLTDAWDDGPRTYLGMQTPGFPNMLTLVGPHNGATFCNIPRCIEQNVDWVTGLIKYMRDNDLAVIEPDDDAVEDWTKTIYEAAEMTLLTRAKSWFMGTNIEGKKKNFLLYAGGNPRYRAIAKDVEENGYKGFNLR